MQKLAIEYLIATRARHPRRTALVEGETHVDYTELWRRVITLADFVARTLPPVPRLPVVVAIPKSIDAVVALLAVQLAGHIYVPFDPTTPPLRRKAILACLEDPPVLARGESGFTLAGHEGGIRPLAAECWLQAEHRLLQGLKRIDSVDPLYVIFTSGTTGLPKGVTIANAAVIDYIDWVVETFAVDHREVIASQAPLFFDNSVLDLYATLATGACLHLLPKEKFVLVSGLMAYLDQHRVSLIFFVPSLLANWATLDLLQKRRLPHLRKLLFAGEPMPLGTLRYLRRHLPHALLANLYGPTEITVDATYWLFGDEIDQLEAVPLGVPCRNKRILFLDEEQRVIEGEDVVGEIAVGGVGVALGYWNDAERSAAVFIQNPAHHHFRETLYRTGDYGYRSGKDGLIYFVGRRDHQIKHMGYRIELGEIEAALGRIEGVRQCCVLYDRLEGEGQGGKIVAFVLAAGSPDPLRWQEALAQSLPPYMIPHRFEALSAMPTTPNGKIDRAVLAARLRMDFEGADA